MIINCGIIKVCNINTILLINVYTIYIFRKHRNVFYFQQLSSFNSALIYI